jgi:hypothetical protein
MRAPAGSAENDREPMPSPPGRREPMASIFGLVASAAFAFTLRGFFPIAILEIDKD